MPLDTLLRPRNKYFGEEQHKIDLEQMHIAYIAWSSHRKNMSSVEKIVIFTYLVSLDAEFL